MRILHNIISFLLLATVPSLQLHLHADFSLDIVTSREPSGPMSYDDFLDLFERLESGNLESRCSEQELTQIATFIAFMAEEGGSSDDESLQADIDELLEGEERFSMDLLAFASFGECQHLVLPSIAFTESSLVPCKSGVFHRIGKFVKKHKKELIIAAVIIVAVTATVVVIAYAGAAGAAGAATAGVAAVASSGEIGPDVEQKITLLKETIGQEELLKESTIPVEEKGRAIGSAFGHTQLPKPEVISHLWIDQQFGTSYPYLYSNPVVDLPALSHQVLGEQALASRNYEEAVLEFDKAIEMAPEAAMYLDRAVAEVGLKNYDDALEDYQEYLEQTPTWIPDIEFMRGAAEGLRQGICQSGKDALHFASQFASHPVQTTVQVYQAFGELMELAVHREWETLGVTLVPEVVDLVQDWQNLDSNERARQACYVFGKLGGDVFLPATTVKVASKGCKLAGKLASVSEQLQTAKKVLVLESLEAVEETAIRAPKYIFEDSTMRASFDLFEKAEASLRQYSKQFLPENQVRELIHKTGIQTFPKPKGVPENFMVKVTRKGAGMEYVHPTNNHIRVRVMPGKPHSEYVCEQKPYVIYTKHGKYVDIHGQNVIRESEGAHIPFENFTYTE